MESLVGRLAAGPLAASLPRRALGLRTLPPPAPPRIPGHVPGPFPCPGDRRVGLSPGAAAARGGAGSRWPALTAASARSSEAAAPRDDRRQGEGGRDAAAAAVAEVTGKGEVKGEDTAGGVGKSVSEVGSSISDFTRFFEDESRGVVELQTSIVTYWKQGPWWDILRPEVQVDLVSVVHIGDPEYYEGLQQELMTYDRVLYEMVSERKPKPKPGQHPPAGGWGRGIFFHRPGTEAGTSSSSSTRVEEYLDSLSDSESEAEGGHFEAIREKLGSLRGGFDEAEEREGSGSATRGAGRSKPRWGLPLHGPRGRPLGLQNALKQPLRSLRRQSKRRGASIVGFIQRNMARLLRLSFQLDHIDYQTPNFLNADLDLATFLRLQRERKESIFSLAKEVSVKSTRAVMATMEGVLHDPALASMGPVRRMLFWASRSVPMPLVGMLLLDTVCRPPGTRTGLAAQPAVQALLNLDVASAFKVFLAQQMSSDALDTAATVMEQSVIVGERNKAAMEELHRALDDGCRRIAVFYGSAHLPDLHRRLRTELGMEPREVQWRTAWSIIGQRSSLWVPDGDAAPGSIVVPTEAELLRERRRRRLYKRRGGKEAVEEEGGGGGAWPMTRYQTLALMLLSLVLAVDLWLWELLFEGVEQSAVQVMVFIGNLLNQGWSL